MPISLISARAWLTDVANARVHATTKEVPHARWAHTERAALLPLAMRPYRSLAVVPDAVPRPAHAPVPRVTVDATPLRHVRHARGGRIMSAPLRERLRTQLADLKMPGALEALDEILRRADSGQLAAGEAIGEVLGSQIQLRNQRRLQTAMRSARLPAVKTLLDFDSVFSRRSSGSSSKICTR